ncbi:MAG: hypothetical protein JW934_05430 [Anaerolineae bacterium]|nr:hypothetical protein [Anaerolineae bacterium]
MSEADNVKNLDRIRYSYSWFSKARFTAGVLVCTIAALVVLSVMIFFIIELINGRDLQITGPVGVDEKYGIAALFLGLGVMIFLCCYFAMLFANFQPDIQVSDNGVWVQIFWFWWFLIPWTDVVAIRPTLTGYILNSSSHIVLVRRLTLLHRSFGLLFPLT